jgi:WD40 repeat protein
MQPSQVDLTSRTGTLSKTSCAFSRIANCLFEGGVGSSNIAILPKEEMDEYIAHNESERDILNSNLHKGFKSNLNKSISCIEIFSLSPTEELLFIGGNKGVEVFQYSSNLALKSVFKHKGEVFCLKAIKEGALIIGRGKIEKKVFKGASAIVLTIPNTKLNSGTKFIARKTKNPYFCMFNTSITGFITKTFKILVIGIHNQERNCLCIENLETGNFFKVKAHTMTIYSVAIDPVSRFMVTGGWDKSLVLWTPKTPLEELKAFTLNSQIAKRFFKEEKRNHNFHESWINHLQIIKRGEDLTNTFVISGGFDYHVKIVSLNRFETLYEFNFGKKVFDCVMYEHDLWVVGDEPDRLLMVANINLKEDQKENVKNNLKNYLENKYADSSIKIKTDKINNIKKNLNEEVTNYQVLLEESQHVINQMEVEKKESDNYINKLLEKINKLERENNKLKDENKVLLKNEKNQKKMLKEIKEIVDESKSNPDQYESGFSQILEKMKSYLK